MATRKIIQVAAMSMANSEKLTYPPSVIALADDGSVWESTYSHNKDGWLEWERLPPLPQE